MFRRTDCYLADEGVESGKYTPVMSSLINAKNGSVYLDTNRPRVCIRGPEDDSSLTLGYERLPTHSIFPFYELRAAAVDLSKGREEFNYYECFNRILAQFKTLKKARIRHVVLSAFGCGAFKNPAPEVARAYHEALTRYRLDFDVVVFAIFDA